MGDGGDREGGDLMDSWEELLFFPDKGRSGHVEWKVAVERHRRFSRHG